MFVVDGNGGFSRFMMVQDILNHPLGNAALFHTFTGMLTVPYFVQFYVIL
ncbi:hypothetical protein PO903_17830 [Paenibacillus sp. PK4536]|nr:hypothetical protein [Paenibacillus sp. PK4536]WIM38491.1 hypothetical protein PO903_17830 [Paenibacillus sp. PK4536]